MSEAPVALITGASRGIGAATAVELARRGYDTALVARGAEELKRVAADIRETGRDAIALAGDLADLDFAESTVAATIDRFGRIDALVNNAVWRELATMRTISLESWERTLRIGLTAPAFMARWAAESMCKRRRGVIVNVSSIMARQAAGTCPAYIACKGALDSLTYELAALYGPSGVRVATLSPGAIDTELSRDAEDTAGDSLADELRRYSEEMIPLGRWGEPREIAAVVAFLASDDAAYITGATITVDGGWSRQHLPLSFRRRQFPEDFA